MSSNPERWAIALQRIAREADARTGTLDLGMLGLTELPEELFALSHLRELDLSGEFGLPIAHAGYLKSIPERLAACGQLRKLSVSGTGIVDLGACPNNAKTELRTQHIVLRNNSVSHI